MQISKACNNIKVSGDCLKCNVMCYIGINPNTSKPKGITFNA